MYMWCNLTRLTIERWNLKKTWCELFSLCRKRPITICIFSLRIVYKEATKVISIMLQEMTRSFWRSFKSRICPNYRIVISQGGCGSWSHFNKGTLYTRLLVCDIYHCGHQCVISLPTLCIDHISFFFFFNNKQLLRTGLQLNPLRNMGTQGGDSQ